MRIVVQVRPQARQEKIEKVDEGHYRVWVTVTPERGKANDAMIDLLAKELHVAKSLIHIVMGKTAREKLVEIKQIP